MTKNDIYDLAAGVALVALAYAVWQHVKASKMKPGLPATGAAYSPTNPGQMTSLADLLNGAITDPLGSTPTVDQITNTALTDFYGTGKSSVVSVNPW